MINRIKNLFKKEYPPESEDNTNVIETPKNECPDCQTIATKMSGGSVIETWNCGNCGRQWMTINELKNE